MESGLIEHAQASNVGRYWHAMRSSDPERFAEVIYLVDCLNDVTKSDTSKPEDLDGPAVLLLVKLIKTLLDHALLQCQSDNAIKEAVNSLVEFSKQTLTHVFTPQQKKTGRIKPAKINFATELKGVWNKWTPKLKTSAYKTLSRNLGPIVTVLGPLKEAAKLAPVGFLGGIFGTTLELAKIARMVKSNNQDIESLCQKAVGLVEKVCRVDRGQVNTAHEGTALQFAVDEFKEKMILVATQCGVLLIMARQPHRALDIQGQISSLEKNMDSYYREFDLQIKFYRALHSSRVSATPYESTLGGHKLIHSITTRDGFRTDEGRPMSPEAASHDNVGFQQHTFNEQESDTGFYKILAFSVAVGVVSGLFYLAGVSPVPGVIGEGVRAVASRFSTMRARR